MGRLEKASVNWKTILAILVAAGAALGVGVWVGSCQGTSRFLERDAEAAALVISLRREADSHRAEATRRAVELARALKTIEGSRKDLEASKGQLEALRRQVRNRPINAAECQDCEVLVKKLDLTLLLADKTIFEQQGALELCERREVERLAADEKCRKVDEVQSERLSDWKKRTRRGRVKTAFLGIGVGVVAGAAGYGIGAATR